MQSSIKVGIADDDQLVRIVLSRALGSFPDLDVVATVDDGAPAVDLAASGGIDVLVLDVEMPGMDGREALNRIRAVAPGVGVLMYSSLPASDHAAAMVQAGAVAYVEKPCDLPLMAEVIREAARARRTTSMGTSSRADPTS